MRADTFGYLQRSFPGIAGETDLNEAMMAGAAAFVNALKAAAGEKGVPVKGTIGIRRKRTRRYQVEFVALPAQDAAKYTRSVPDEFIAKNGHDVTPAFIAYAKPLVDELPHCELLG